MSEEDKERIFRQIAALVLAGVDLADMAKVLDLDEDKLTAVMALDDYKEAERRMLEKRMLGDQTFNNNWDDMETHAIKIVQTHLKAAPRDGEFALRAAMVANKARRRSINQDSIIDGGKTARAAVTLPMKFVTKLQSRNGELTITQEVGNTEEPKKPLQRIDCLLPAQVENLFSMKEEENNDLLAGLTF